MNKFEIRVGQSTSDSEVILNGAPLKGVTKVSFILQAGNKTFLSLEIDGEVKVEGVYASENILNVKVPSDKGIYK